MSLLAVQWVQTLQVGNHIAKSLLSFLAQNNFHTPGYYFGNEVLAHQLEVSVRAVQRAFKILYDKNLIKTETRFDPETGRQTTNYHQLLIPQEFLDAYNDKLSVGMTSVNKHKKLSTGATNSRQKIDLSTGEGDTQSSQRVTHSHPRGDTQSSGVAEKQLNSSNKSESYREEKIPNNNINNNINKSFTPYPKSKKPPTSELRSTVPFYQPPSGPNNEGGNRELAIKSLSEIMKKLGRNSVPCKMDVPHRTNKDEYARRNTEQLFSKEQEVPHQIF